MAGNAPLDHSTSADLRNMPGSYWHSCPSSYKMSCCSVLCAACCWYYCQCCSGLVAHPVTVIWQWFTAWNTGHEVPATITQPRPMFVINVTFLVLCMYLQTRCQCCRPPQSSLMPLIMARIYNCIGVLYLQGTTRSVGCSGGKGLQ